jgi:formylglycine-generating enzyme required for sulfatase activity
MNRMKITLTGCALSGIAWCILACAADERATSKTTTIKISLPKTTVQFEMVSVPPGKIRLGEKEIEIKPIWIGKTEVTWDEYDAYFLELDLPEKERIRSGPSNPLSNRPGIPYEPPDRGWGHEGFPAGSIPFIYAQRYCEWLSKNTGKKYRLPTEAEWEYACRAGGKAAKIAKDVLEKSAWYADNSDDQTHHVAKKDANAWGLFDTLGNVAEWVVKSDGTGAIAGGSFQDEAADVWPGARAVYDKTWQRNDPQDPQSKSWYTNGAHVGFRLVMDE